MDADAVTVVADPAIVSVELDGKLSIYRPATQVVLNLNESASVIWLELEDGPARSVAALADELADRFAVDPATMLADVRAAVEHLAAAGFVSARDPG